MGPRDNSLDYTTNRHEITVYYRISVFIFSSRVVI